GGSPMRRRDAGNRAPRYDEDDSEIGERGNGAPHDKLHGPGRHAADHARRRRGSNPNPLVHGNTSAHQGRWFISLHASDMRAGRKVHWDPMSTTTQPEAWMRGPIEGIDPMLMPVAHALVQAREDLGELVASVRDEHVWQRPGGAASIGFHVRHLGGALDRLFTYARGERLSDAQKAAVRGE